MTYFIVLIQIYYYSSIGFLIIYYTDPTTNTTINRFSDDTKLSISFNNINDRDKLQLAINKFYNWSVLWQLENSAKKSFSLTLGKVT